MPTSDFSPVPDWGSVRLGQLARLAQLGDYKTLLSMSEGLKIAPKVLSRDLASLEKLLGLPHLTEQPHRSLQLTQRGRALAEAVEPLLSLIQRLMPGEIPPLRPFQFRLGGGGSLISWLVGSRIEAIKLAFKEELPQGKFRLMTDDVSLHFEPFTNRDAVLAVCAGALDCALVRHGVLGDKRLPLKHVEIGEITYYLYVPKHWIASEYLKKKYQTWGIPSEIEREILETRPIATVGPDGECRLRLDTALQGEGIQANIEFSYRAFPMLLPHMMRRTHMTIMPNIAQMEDDNMDPDGTKIRGYVKFPLKILSGYRRHIRLIVHKDHKKRMPWLHFETLRKALQFNY